MALFVAYGISSQEWMRVPMKQTGERGAGGGGGGGGIKHRVPGVKEGELLPSSPRPRNVDHDVVSTCVIISKIGKKPS